MTDTKFEFGQTVYAVFDRPNKDDKWKTMCAKAEVTAVNERPNQTEYRLAATGLPFRRWWQERDMFGTKKEADKECTRRNSKRQQLQPAKQSGKTKRKS